MPVNVFKKVRNIRVTVMPIFDDILGTIHKGFEKIVK